MPGTSTEQVVDKGIRQKSTKEWTHSLTAVPFVQGHRSVFPRIPRNTGVYTRHPTFVTATSGVLTRLPAKLSKKRNACLHAVRQAVGKKIACLNGLRSEGVKLTCDVMCPIISTEICIHVYMCDTFYMIVLFNTCSANRKEKWKLYGEVYFKKKLTKKTQQYWFTGLYLEYIVLNSYQTSETGEGNTGKTIECQINECTLNVLNTCTCMCIVVVLCVCIHVRCFCVLLVILLAITI